MKSAIIQTQGLFHTPESMEELEKWIEKHPPEERGRLYTAVWMFNNLLASHDVVEIKRTGAA